MLEFCVSGEADDDVDDEDDDESKRLSALIASASWMQPRPLVLSPLAVIGLLHPAPDLLSIRLDEATVPARHVCASCLFMERIDEKPDVVDMIELGRLDDDVEGDLTTTAIATGCCRVANVSKHALACFTLSGMFSSRLMSSDRFHSSIGLVAVAIWLLDLHA